MAKDPQKPDKEPQGAENRQDDETPFRRFERLAKRVVAVPKDKIPEKRPT